FRRRQKRGRPAATYLQVASIAASISLIDLSSEASVVRRLSPVRHSAATARKAREVPRYSPLTLQNVFLTEAFFLSSATWVVAFLISSMVVSTFLVAISSPSSRLLTTVSQSSSARADVPSANRAPNAIAASAVVIAFIAALIRNSGRPGSAAGGSSGRARRASWCARRPRRGIRRRRSGTT